MNQDLGSMSGDRNEGQRSPTRPEITAVSENRFRLSGCPVGNPWHAGPRVQASIDDMGKAGQRVKIGIGPSAYGIRARSGHGQVPWERFLDEARSVGFDGVELGTLGYLPRDGERLRDELATRHLELAAGALIADFAFGRSWATTEQRTQSLCELFRRTGTSRLVLIDAPAAPDQSPRQGGALPRRAWLQMINRVHEVSSHAK